MRLGTLLNKQSPTTRTRRRASINHRIAKRTLKLGNRLLGTLLNKQSPTTRTRRRASINHR
ncbi:MAG: hypothetical protein QCI38_05890, partial [Candidatus Thermoplasmatota archaeon]|nr:hypothetical protein [Candidatus Thermoplasmatota archaeon]